MLIKLLGPLEIVDHGRRIRLVGNGQRVVIASLAVEQGKIVPVERLVMALWGNNPPASARTKIQAHVCAVRQAIGRGVHDAGSPLLTIPPGYILSEEDTETDVAKFDALATQGSAAADSGQPDTASALLGDALALWRGAAFADVIAPSIRGTARVLEERRLLAAETKAEADLALGRLRTMVTELSALLISYPLRERLRGLLMLALHGLGCRADALTVYRAGHQLMMEELGLEPSAWLRGQYRRILADEPQQSLDPHGGFDRGDERPPVLAAASDLVARAS
jgi:DNA-binding SARP family transcriptional activator